MHKEPEWFNIQNQFNKIMRFDVGLPFNVGINFSWFGGAYNHDLGYNKLHPTWTPYIANSTNNQAIESLFNQISTCDLVVRVWLFEGLEALDFDNKNQVTGFFDPTFKDNVKKLLEWAENNQVQVYFCLLDMATVDFSNPNDPITSKLVTLLKNSSNFIEYVLKPLISYVGNSSALVAIDLMNEPDDIPNPNPQSVPNPNSTGINSTHVTRYLQSCSTVIKTINNRILVSCGFRSLISDNYHMGSLNFYKNDIAAYLDFFDFHLYNEDGSLPSYSKSDFAGKPCIIGECGYPVSDNMDHMEEVQVAQNFLDNSLKLGYAGCILWYVDYTNKESILQKAKDFAGTKPIIQSPQ